MGRFVVLILDGFGIGAMADVPMVRPTDLGANSCRHIFQRLPELRLPTLEKLGLMNAADFETAVMKKNKEAIFGHMALQHDGADTFFGHQEIMGTMPQKAVGEPIAGKLERIFTLLVQEGFAVRYYQGRWERLLVVDEAVTIADNIECDRGQAFNVTAALDLIAFERVMEIGMVVRSVAVVPRVIVFGGNGVSLGDLLSAIEETGDGYIGVNAPKSGVYRKNYHCIHLGYGVDPMVQAPVRIAAVQVPVFLLGKAADVIQNPQGESFSIVSTQQVMEKAKELLEIHETAFICANVQETDLCGHQEDAASYGEILEIADRGIAQILPLLSAEDVLIVLADHGNDPTIGHPHHTREYVPLLVFAPGKKGRDLGLRSTLSDVGATACDYFSAQPPQNGRSFWKEICQ